MAQAAALKSCVGFAGRRSDNETDCYSNNNDSQGDRTDDDGEDQEKIGTVKCTLSQNGVIKP